MSLFISMLCSSTSANPLVQPQPALLPVGAHAVLPERSAQPFSMQFQAATLPALPAALVPTQLAGLLPATGWTGSVEDLEFRGEQPLPAAGALPARRLLRYQQVLAGAEVEGMGVLVVVDDTGLRSLSGALLNERSILNRRLWKQLPEAENTVAVLRLEGEGLRHAWRLRLASELLWLDAENGVVLERQSRVFGASAVGMAFQPDPLGELEERHFAVDRPVDGLWTLQQSGSLVVLPGGADGSWQPLAIPDNGADWADFRSFGTPEVEDISNPNYNPFFAQINLYSQLSEDLRVWTEWGGQYPGQIRAWTAHADPCGRGTADGACAWPGELYFGLGEATKGGRGAFHSALDGSLVSHELAHLLLTAQQEDNGGFLDAAIAEGFADYFSASRHGIAQIGAWTWAEPTPDLPRLLSQEDSFPLGWLQGGGDPHATGQILARALLNCREELGSNATLLDPWLADALSRAGLGQRDLQNPQPALRDLLLQLLLSAGDRPESLEIVQGFARVGIFTSPQEAVVDVHADILKEAPTFTIWGGEAFVLDDGGLVRGQAWNPTWILELASDAEFSENRWSSGPQSGITTGPNGVASQEWTLPDEAWQQLSSSSDLYYRLTTMDGRGGNLRSSTHYAAEAMPLPVGHAVIRATHSSVGCTSAGLNSTSGAGLLLGLCLAFRRRS